MRHVLRSLALLFCGALSNLSCQDTGAEDTKRSVPSNQIVAPAHIRADSLAIEIVQELNDNLVNRSSLTPEQARVIANKAAGALEIVKLELLLLAAADADSYEDRIESFADELVKGALDALDEVKLVHQRQVNKVLEEILVSLMESMEGRTDHLDSKALSELSQALAKAAMHQLDEAGYSVQSMAEGARTIAATAIASLDEAGILTSENGQDVLIAIISGSIHGLAEGPIASSPSGPQDYATVMDDLLYGAVGSLDDAGFSLAAIDDSLAPIMFAALSSFDELGLKAQDLELPITAAIHGAMDALKREAGVTDPAQLEKALGFCVSGAVSGLAQSQMPLEAMDEVISIIVKRTVQHVDNLGVSDAETENVMKEIILAAIGALSEAGFSTAHIEAYGDVMADITVATMEGLVEVGFTAAEINSFLDDITASAFDPLRDHGFTKAQAQIIGSHFLTRLQAGLSASTEIVLPYDAAVMNAHVQSALDAAYDNPAPFSRRPRTWTLLECACAEGVGHEDRRSRRHPR